VGKRIKNYINEIGKLLQNELTEEEIKFLRENLLTQILFFQHERLIHLIVTVTFAAATVISLACIVITKSIIMSVFLLLLLSLLVPYIRHNYILEKGVQKLYEYYDLLEKKISKL